MNQDFLLPSSPAMARKLIRLSCLTHIDLDPNIAAMAEHDRIGPEAFDDLLCPHSPERQVMTQFLLDSGMRAGVLPDNPLVARATILNAARVAGIGKVTVATRDPKAWRHAIAASGLPKEAVAVLSHRKAFDYEEQQDRRDGLLVQDWHGTTISFEQIECFTAMARQFPKTVIVTDGEALESAAQGRIAYDSRFHHRHNPYNDAASGKSGAPWWEMGAVLFPMMPTDHFMMGDGHLHREVLGRPVWEGTYRDDLSHLFNVWLPKNHWPEIVAASR